MSSCSQVGCLEMLMERQWSNKRRSWYNLLSTNDQSPSWYWTSHEPCGPSSSSFALLAVMGQVCRSYWKCIVDLAGTRLTAVSVQHRWLLPGHPEGRQGGAGHPYRILLLATDAARQPGL